MKLFDKDIQLTQYEIVLMHLLEAGEDNTRYRLPGALSDLDQSIWYSTHSLQQMIFELREINYTSATLGRQVTSALYYLASKKLIESHPINLQRTHKTKFFRVNNKGMMYLKTKYDTIGLVDNNKLIRLVSQRLQEVLNENPNQTTLRQEET